MLTRIRLYEEGNPYFVASFQIGNVPLAEAKKIALRNAYKDRAHRMEIIEDDTHRVIATFSFDEGAWRAVHRPVFA